MDSKNEIINYDDLRLKLKKKQFIYVDVIKNTLKSLKIKKKKEKKRPYRDVTIIL